MNDIFSPFEQPTMPVPFDPTADLPAHTTVIEAGAGTGKTYAIASIATRMIALGKITIDRLMLVTFARLATFELRSRVHERMQTTLAIIQKTLAGEKTEHLDKVDLFLIDTSSAELAKRAERLEQALSHFDLATIATTHEFCARLLEQLGILVDHDRAAHFIDDTTLLRRHVTTDVFLSQAITQQTNSQQINPENIEKVAANVLDHPGLPLLPPPDQASAQLLARTDLVQDVRDTFQKRKYFSQIYGYTDMVQRVVEALDDPITGSLAADVLATRYDLIMVDEFQDTDPFQWKILERAFHGRTRLVVIGDPRQSIYAFRGADLYAYHDATRRAERRFTLDHNYRSDAAIVQGIAALFGSCNLGTEQASITLTPLISEHQESRLKFESAPGKPGVQIRAIPAQQPMYVPPARRAIAADLVRVCGELLAGAEVLDKQSNIWRHLEPSDIAVLVRRKAAGQKILQALTAAGIPAVFTGGEGVFASEAAQAWLALLEAILEPRLSVSLRFSTTLFVGWSPQQLASADQDRRAELLTTLKALRGVWERKGVMAMYEAASATFDLVPRLLSLEDGERKLTDLRHLAERLNAVERQKAMNAQGLSSWLRGRITQAKTDQDDDAVRRLETDQKAVSIMTIHRAKGLEFPVVALPDMADKYGNSRSDGLWSPTLLHHDGHLSIDLFQDESAQRREIHLAEEQAEDLRLLYVAATRAQSHLIAWWANTKNNLVTSPLHRLLNAHKTSHEAPLASVIAGRDPNQWPLDRSLIQVITIPKPSGRPLSPAIPKPSPHISVRHFHDYIDREWTRTSYSGLTVGLHGVPMDIDAIAGADEVENLEDSTVLAIPQSGKNSDPSAPTALTGLPGGTQFGSLVHGILEIVDPASHNLHNDLITASEQLLAQWPVADVSAETLAAGLACVLKTPLGTLSNNRSLCDLGASNRLAEMDFEIPMGSAQVTHKVADLAALWSDSALMPATDPLASYGALLASTEAAPRALAGFLTGSIDGVLRINPAASDNNSPDPSAAKYCLIDYKTNRIPVPAGQLLSPSHYSAEAMTRAMIQAHYPLQALLYSVALHRYLSHRLPDYEPSKHLGGAGYLFVRGMTGNSSATINQSQMTPQPGVFLWHPRPEFVQAASEILAGDPR